MTVLEEISEYLQKGRAPLVRDKVKAALDEGISPKDILENGLLAGMGVVGEKFKNGELFVPEVMIAARAMNMGVGVLKPYLAGDGIGSKGTVVIGTVRGDQHDIGKNLVKLMMEGQGLKVIDLGTDVSPEAFVDAATENEASVICCSALLTTTMEEMRNVVECAKEKGIRDKVFIMVGGAPVTQEFCDEIGADCYTADAASAAEAAASYCRRSD